MVRTLCEPIVDNGIKNTNFFNGRLLSAEDLKVEQAAQRQRELLLGQAAGPGVVGGLEVSLDNFQVGALNNTLLVRQGVAINAAGQILYSPDDVQVQVAGLPQGTLVSGGSFGLCSTDLALPTSIGIYLLVLSPASDLRGSAPLSGLGQNGKISGCGKRYEMEGVQFRLIKVSLDASLGIDSTTAAAMQGLVTATNLPWTTGLPASDAADLSTLRSLVAYQALGAAAAGDFARNPFQLIQGQPAFEQYGLIDQMVANPAKPVGLEDVPLALVYWTARGIRFVDTWSVRRRPAPRFQDGPWGYALGDRRLREGEAMILQFDDQLQALLGGTDGFPKVSPASLQARQHFAYLPPAGLLPVDGTGGSRPGIQPVSFFSGMKIRALSEDPLFIEGAGLPALLREAAAYPPVDPTSPEMIWVYRVRANQQAVTAGGAGAPGLYLVFANGHIPLRDDPRYDVRYWNYGNFA